MHDERFFFGALPTDRAHTEFRFRAPADARVALETDDGRRFPLEAAPAGGWKARLPLPPGTAYRFRVEHSGRESTAIDPAASALAAQDAGFGVVVDPTSFAWRHDDWRGRPWHEAVVCELDTRGPGGFEAALGRLPALAAIGITAVALSPVARLSGQVFPFAPDPARGRPDDLRRLVDAAHGSGLMVLVGGIEPPHGRDVRIADETRFLAECAARWAVDYRVDGLRLGAATATAEVARAVREAAGPHRRFHLLLEGDDTLPPGFADRWPRETGFALQVAADGPSGGMVSVAALAPGSGTDSAGLADLVARLLSPDIPSFVEQRTPVSHDVASHCRRLLALRRERLVPHLAGARNADTGRLGAAASLSAWVLGDGSRLVVARNCGPGPVAWPDAPAAASRVYEHGGDGADLPEGGARVYIVTALPRDLADLAERAGIAIEWFDQSGRPHTLSRDTVERVLEALGHACDNPTAIAASLSALKAAQAAPSMLTARVGEPFALPLPDGFAPDGVRATLVLESGETRELLPAVRAPDEPGAPPVVSFDGLNVPGYHRLELIGRGRSHALTVAIAPPRAFDAGLEKAWGTAVQIYALRPETSREGPDPGLGDFSALAAFARSAGAAGAQIVAISPTHAGFAADPTSFSPYSPSSRLFHNVLFIDPLAAAGTALAAADGIGSGAPAPVETDSLIDWPQAGAWKLRWLRALFDRLPFEAAPAVPDGLRLHATFEALHAHFHASHRSDWRQWPDAFQNPDSDEVAEFVATHADDVRFHLWLQHLAEAGLQRAQDAAREAGMRVGLVADLAIGMSGAGSHAWASRRDLLVGLEIGAPPDSMNPRGQSWGLTAFSPRALAERQFEPFLQTLRAAMRHAGGVRIDHVLGLNRLWLVPSGLPATDGAYVSYPFRDFLNLLILESHRHRAIVIGEDLGTVPDGFREVLADAGVRGMAVLWLERAADGTSFKPPQEWSRDAVAMTTTHDLPTAAGWWAGRDIDWGERIFNRPDAAAARRARDAERAALQALSPETDSGEDGVDLAIAAVARAPSGVALVPIEDLLGLVEQPNLPGTVDEHPNWRRRLPGAADALLDNAPARRRVELLTTQRRG